jgi:hypothetical protein
LKAAKELLFAPALFGLVALFGVICISVMVVAPKPQTPLEMRNMLVGHLSVLHFMDAEIMAHPLFPDPDARWSHFRREAGSDCNPIGNNVWHARGSVVLPKDDSEQTFFWEVYFVPEDRKPIYIRVGDVKFGDSSAALRLAGVSESNRKGVIDGK